MVELWLPTSEVAVRENATQPLTEEVDEALAVPTRTQRTTHLVQPLAPLNRLPQLVPMMRQNYC